MFISTIQKVFNFYHKSNKSPCRCSLNVAGISCCVEPAGRCCIIVVLANIYFPFYSTISEAFTKG